MATQLEEVKKLIMTATVGLTQEFLMAEAELI
jgi:hypothetical protein